jgi:hypothetical protein
MEVLRRESPSAKGLSSLICRTLALVLTIGEDAAADSEAKGEPARSIGLPPINIVNDHLSPRRK